MLIRVIDNNTNAIINQVNTNDWATAKVSYIDNFRRKYTGATIEWYYGITAKDKPAATYKTFH